MKVTSESGWQQVKAGLVSDPDPRSQVMMDFITTWAELAEVVLTDAGKIHELGNMTPIEALRATLVEAERTSGHVIPIMQLGQALLILASVWQPSGADRERFIQSMSAIERKLFAEMATMWQAHHQQQAQQQESV